MEFIVTRNKELLYFKLVKKLISCELNKYVSAI